MDSGASQTHELLLANPTPPGEHKASPLLWTDSFAFLILFASSIRLCGGADSLKALGSVVGYLADSSFYPINDTGHGCWPVLWSAPARIWLTRRCTVPGGRCQEEW